MGHFDAHIQVCLSVTQVLNVCVKSKTDPPSDFKHRRIFPLQPQFWVGFFKTTPLKTILVFLDVVTRNSSYMGGNLLR